MTAFQASRIVALALRPGDVVWRYWDSGACGASMQPLRVVRVNRVTVTVETEQGGRFRAPLEQIEGRYTEGDDAWTRGDVR